MQFTFIANILTVESTFTREEFEILSTVGSAVFAHVS